MIKKVIKIFAILLICGAGVYFGLMYFNKKTAVKEIKTLDEIKGYSYSLRENDTALFKTNYEALEHVLTSKEIDFKEYAKYASSLFIIDLYTINNKTNKYDVGGKEFVYPSIASNYELNVSDTIYRYVKDNSVQERKQELPEVSEINVSDVSECEYKIDSEGKTYSAYKVTLDWKYVTDLGYDTKGIVTLIKVDNNLYVVEKE